MSMISTLYLDKSSS